jgi:hypothetical protein
MRNHNLKETGLDILPPITANGRVEIDGAMSVCLHNAGTVTATINGGLTVEPGATFMLGVPAVDVVISDILTVHFSNPVGARLEVIQQRVKGKAYSNFSNGSTH